MNLTPGHVLRHIPLGSRATGREAALVDIAQDLLLRELNSVGIMDYLVFKGGTALRKLYAGNAGRFSLDLDFSVRELGSNADAVLDMLQDHVIGLNLGPFTYDIAHRRGKRHLLVASAELGTPENLSSKLDLSPPPWLAPTMRGWVPMPIHSHYGSPALPSLPVVRLEENLAEKISRLNRATPARDMYDLWWIAENLLRTELDRVLVRRMAVLKVWVDTNGVSAADGTVWQPAHAGGSFVPARWLRLRDPDEYDEEDIGTLAVPPPRLAELSRKVREAYGFLADLDADEKQIALAQPRDRGLAIRLLADLPGGRLSGADLH